MTASFISPSEAMQIFGLSRLSFAHLAKGGARE